MGQVMLREEDATGGDPELALDAVSDPELVAEPGDHRLLEQPARAGEGPHAREEQALELHEGLLEERHVVERPARDAARPETEVDRPPRELEIVLAPAEALLLGGGDEPPVPQEGRGGVMEVAGDPEDVHGAQNWRRASAGEVGGASSRSRQPPGAGANGSARPRTSRQKGPSTR